MSEWRQHRRLRARASLASVGLAAAASATLAFAPFTAQQDAVQSIGPGSVSPPAAVRITHASLFDTQGSAVLIPLAVPIGLTTAGFAYQRWRGVMVVMAALLWGFCVLGALSIGLFYIPSHIALVIAIAAPPARDRKSAATTSA